MSDDAFYERLYGQKRPTEAESVELEAQVEATLEALSVGVSNPDPVSLETFEEAMIALRAAGFSNIRELEGSGYQVWYETLKNLGQELFLMTIQRVLHSGNEKFRTGRVLLGDIIKVADDTYFELLNELKEQAFDDEMSDTPPKLRYYHTTKQLGLPRVAPADQVKSLNKISALTALSVADRLSLPAGSSNRADVGIESYDPNTHSSGDVF